MYISIYLFFSHQTPKKPNPAVKTMGQAKRKPTKYQHVAPVTHGVYIHLARHTFQQKSTAANMPVPVRSDTMLHRHPVISGTQERGHPPGVPFKHAEMQSNSLPLVSGMEMESDMVFVSVL
eukprot:GEMP01022899.1.p2 GENE.GEMP01022899.1~~GEMP01022899.1.p2  ORF type:complete len:121 (-),score=19.63 GEMP01022899.1:582-944(-)